MKTIKAEIPYSGTYYSGISSEIDHQIESYVDWMNEQAGTEIEAYGNIDIHDGIEYQTIAKAYANKFADYLEYAIDFYPESLKFDGLYMPKYYNFENDRIFVTLSESDMREIWERVDKENFSAWLLERMRPRDGFIPHYSNQIEDNPTDICEWEIPMLGLVFEFIEYDCCEKHGESAEFQFLYNDGYEDICNAISFRDWNDVVSDWKEWNEI